MSLITKAKNRISFWTIRIQEINCTYRDMIMECSTIMEAWTGVIIQILTLNWVWIEENEHSGASRRTCEGDSKWSHRLKIYVDMESPECMCLYRF